jgi:hypothetical protein
MYPETHRCINCKHWRGDYDNKVYASIEGKKMWVGQCAGNEESDNAPFADLDNGAEAFVFTPENGVCKAFFVHPDAEEAQEVQDWDTYNGARRGTDYPATHYAT